MKKNLLSVLLAVLVLGMLLSCESNNESFQRTNSIQHIYPTKKHRIINGMPVYTGFGYDPINNSSFQSAIESFCISSNTNITNPVEIKLITITTHNELNQFLNDDFFVERSATLSSQFEANSKTQDVIEKQIRIGENYLTVVARIRIKSNEYLIDNYPMLNPKLESMVENQKFGLFTENYGTMYINKQTTGGEVYYIYNYDCSLVNRWTKSVFTEKAKAFVTSYFKTNSQSKTSSKEIEIISKAKHVSGIISSIPGYTPNNVIEVSDVEKEIFNIQNYLNDNPRKAITIGMQLKPYSSFLPFSELKNISDKKIECLKHLSEWHDLQRQLTTISKYSSGEINTKATSALEEVEIQIKNAKKYSDAIPPAKQNFQEIFTTWNHDQNLIPLYHYKNDEGNHFYTTDFNKFGKGKDNYQLLRAEGKIFKTEMKGTIPLYHYHKGNNHFYTNDYNEIREGKYGYQLDGIAGYLYSVRLENTVPLHRYNDGRSHFYTVDFLGESFDDYLLEGNVGYIFKN